MTRWLHQTYQQNVVLLHNISVSVSRGVAADASRRVKLGRRPACPRSPTSSLELDPDGYLARLYFNQSKEIAMGARPAIFLILAAIVLSSRYTPASALEYSSR